jgi:hypothetical protein
MKMETPKLKVPLTDLMKPKPMEQAKNNPVNSNLVKPHKSQP